MGRFLCPREASTSLLVGFRTLQALNRGQEKAGEKSDLPKKHHEFLYYHRGRTKVATITLDFRTFGKQGKCHPSFLLLLSEKTYSQAPGFSSSR